MEQLIKKGQDLPTLLTTALRNRGCFLQFISLTLLYAILQAITGFLRSGITSDDQSISQTCITLFICLVVANPILNFFYDYQMKRIINVVCTDFMTCSYKVYESMSFESKNSEPAQIFRNKLVDATNSIYQCISWGLPNIISIFSTTVSSIYIFYVNGLGSWLIFIIVFNFLIYYFVTVDLQYQLTKEREKAETIRKENVSMIHSYLPMFEVGNKNVGAMIEKEIIVFMSWNTSDGLWRIVTMVTELTNNVVFVIFLINPLESPMIFLLIASTIINFSSGLQQFMSFMNQYERIKISYGTFAAIWKNKKFEPEPDRLDMPNPYVITEIRVGDRLRTNLLELSINCPSKILLQAPSGSGKTTFLNALTGKIQGIHLQHGLPVNFRHQISEFFQNIKEKMPTDTITLRQLFGDEANNCLIDESLRICGLFDWANEKIKEKESMKRIVPQKRINIFTRFFGNSKETEKRSATEEVGKHPYDIQLHGLPSGGEKTRIALATVVHKLLIDESIKWLILDEPESGLDPELIYQILDNIFSRFSDKTIIVVSHLEQIRQKYCWNNYLTIRDGLIVEQGVDV